MSPARGSFLMEQLTVEQIRAQLRTCDEDQFRVLERSLIADTRKGVGQALQAARVRIQQQVEERARLDALYTYESELLQRQNARILVGLDEVGRGPLAGPLVVGAVVLSSDHRIEDLNDSKQLTEGTRKSVAVRIKETALAWSTQHASAAEIDKKGIMGALRSAFKKALVDIEAQGIVPDVIALDGNSLHLDAREVNVIKGDSLVASIAAASVIAKVERDAYMEQLDQSYPQYGFAQHKGYGTKAHREAISVHGLSPLHRVSFCREFTQASLF